jgi:hypothetical protein
MKIGGSDHGNEYMTFDNKLYCSLSVYFQSFRGTALDIAKSTEIYGGSSYVKCVQLDLQSLYFPETET